MYSNSANKAIDYFSKLGFECPSHFNPSEFFIKILSKETKSVENLDTSAKGWKRRISNLDEAPNESNYSFKICQNEDELLKDNIEYENTINKFHTKFLEENKISDLSQIEVNNNKLHLPSKKHLGTIWTFI